MCPDDGTLLDAHGGERPDESADGFLHSLGRGDGECHWLAAAVSVSFRVSDANARINEQQPHADRERRASGGRREDIESVSRVYGARRPRAAHASNCGMCKEEEKEKEEEEEKEEENRRRKACEPAIANATMTAAVEMAFAATIGVYHAEEIIGE